MADVDVDDIPTAPEPAVIVPLTFRTEAPDSEMPAAALEPFTLPVTVIVIAVAEDMPLFEAPFMLPEMFTVGVDVILMPTAGLVAPEPPVTEPVIVRVVPEKLMLWFNTAPVVPPVMFPTIVKLPADWFITGLPPTEAAAVAPVMLPIITESPAVEFKAAFTPVVVPTVAPIRLPTIVIAPVDDLFMQ